MTAVQVNIYFPLNFFFELQSLHVYVNLIGDVVKDVTIVNSIIWTKHNVFRHAMTTIKYLNFRIFSALIEVLLIIETDLFRKNFMNYFAFNFIRN